MAFLVGLALGLTGGGGSIFAAAGMRTAPIGVRAVQWFSETTILTTFAVLMIVIAVSMWHRASRHPGLFGVGGGFLIVPALTFIAQLDMHRAVATSLLVIALIGLSGVIAVFVEGRELPWTLTALFVVGGFAGMMLGRMLARRIAGPRLQNIFSMAIVLVAVFVFISRQH